MNAPSIRRWSQFVAVAAVLAAAGSSTSATPPATGHEPEKTERKDLTGHAQRLLAEGNQRFVDGKSIHPNTDVFRVADTGEHGQHPFAVVVGCADSRAAVERIFDRGMGDLFVVRTAGNVVDASQAGSVEYACEHLGSQLVVAMGHTKCGAVKAAVGGVDGGKNINAFLDNITPCVKSVKASHPQLAGDELVDAVVRENAFETIEDLLQGSSMLRGMVQSGQVKMVAAVYDVQTGKVEWLGQHPALAGLLKGAGDDAVAHGEDPHADAAGEPASEKTASAEKPGSEKPGTEKPMQEKSPTPRPVAAKPASAPAKPAAAPKHEPAAGGTDHAAHPH